MNRQKKTARDRDVSSWSGVTGRERGVSVAPPIMDGWHNGVCSVARAIIMLAFLGFCSGAYADNQEDPRDAAHAWRINHNPQLERMWGINVIGVRLVSSNWMLQFKYQVTDPEKARLLLDHQAKPYLTDKPSGAMLAVPAMENVGELRQVSSLVAGRDYFIIFGNASKVVRRGNRVNIEVGAFHADDLMVE
ncbi:hypothetical protein [Glaciimonas immobilis]|uniref:Uncharacterized protein n=1 Tax=Glaciimonas immobilis TaxID=728004 RepID=A0A840RXM7_9BURK|nr:hypothetical protein [Glaciimonas immobilis]KAF3996029.1 hypothetical protein HAV38_19925 [Glaciimonas immobilis]MBB5201848.1 hypothetical protein [Glaciimonas immobilis]